MAVVEVTVVMDAELRCKDLVPWNNSEDRREVEGVDDWGIQEVANADILLVHVLEEVAVDARIHGNTEDTIRCSNFLVVEEDVGDSVVAVLIAPLCTVLLVAR